MKTYACYYIIVNERMAWRLFETYNIFLITFFKRARACI